MKYLKKFNESLNESKIPITFWINPDNEITCAELEFEGKKHQTADIREFPTCLVLSRNTLVENMKFPMVEDRHLKYGFTKKEVVVDVEIQKEINIGYTYIYLNNLKIFKNKFVD